jgi:hypothetical protein
MIFPLSVSVSISSPSAISSGPLISMVAVVRRVFRPILAHVHLSMYTFFSCNFNSSLALTYVYVQFSKMGGP